MQEVVTDQNSLDLSSDSIRPRTGPAASSPSNELFPSSTKSKVQTQDWRKTGKEFSVQGEFPKHRVDHFVTTTWNGMDLTHVCSKCITGGVIL